MASRMDSPDDYPHLDEENIRFCDTDALGHVNNVAITAYYETGRSGIMHAIGTLGGKDVSSVIARIEVDYLAEMHWPGKIVIGSRIVAMGRSSVTLEQALFQNGRCTGRSRSVIVTIDNHARAPMPLSDEMRSRYAAFMTPTAEADG